MVMTSEQAAAFRDGAGNLPAETLSLAIAMIAMTLLTLWTAWVAFGQYRAWLKQQVSAFDLLWLVLRASMVLLLLGFFIRP